MTTQAQIDANRRNAKQSTGPTSAEGKRRVSRNAITHSLNCRDILLPEEDEQKLALYRRAMIADHQPVGAEEQDCVERMVCAYWRIQRTWRAETGAYAHERYRLGSKDYDEAACVMHNLQQEKTFAYLDRKEAHLSREYNRCSRRLQELQDQRRKGTRHVIEDEPIAEPTAVQTPVAATTEATASSDNRSGEITEQSQMAVAAPTVEESTGNGGTIPMAASHPDDGRMRESAEQSQLMEEMEAMEQRAAA